MIMTHEEMSNFTHEELENFRHLELSLEKTDLLNNLISDFRDDIPSAVLIKLHELCKGFIQYCEEQNISIPSETKKLKNKKTLTLNEIHIIISMIYMVISIAYMIYSTISSSSPSNNIYINQITNYIEQNNYINNIDIINEIFH